MNKTLKIIFITMILMIATDAISHAISGDPIANVKQKVEDLSGIQNLLTLSYRTTSIGPFQSVSIKFQQTENTTISATYHSWFGLSPAKKCYSESAKTPCHS